MVSMSDKLKERNVLKLILIARFVCATLDVGHPILSFLFSEQIYLNLKEEITILFHSTTNFARGFIHLVPTEGPCLRILIWSQFTFPIRQLKSRQFGGYHNRAHFTNFVFTVPLSSMLYRTCQIALSQVPGGSNKSKMLRRSMKFW
jgi:hypothetical protein